MKQWLQEQKDDDREYRTGDYQRGESGSCNGGRDRKWISFPIFDAKIVNFSTNFDS